MPSATLSLAAQQVVAGIADAGEGERADQAGAADRASATRWRSRTYPSAITPNLGDRIMKPIGRYKLARAFQQVSTRCGGVW
jgi:hypothetical protein